MKQFFFVVVISLYCQICFSAENGTIISNNKPIQELLSKLVGTWVSDVEYTKEYLQKGAELQRLWCGYGWPENEIKKRETLIRNEVKKKGPLSTWKFRDIGDGSVELLTESHSKKLLPTIISNCKKIKKGMNICKQNPVQSRPFVFKIDDNYLYTPIFKMTPQIMKCEIKSYTPKEIWMPVIRFIKVNTDLVK